MKRQLIAGAAAVALGIGTVAAQSTGSTAGAAAGQGRRIGAPAPQVTLIGCVEFEQDYRKRMEAGRGGVLGSGAGANDEFVLTNARPADDGPPAAGARGRGAASGMGAGGGVYTMTGPQEKNLKRDVGRQVEVVGAIENLGKPSTGADLTDISDLPRIAISAWHPVGDFCPAK